MKAVKVRQNKWSVLCNINKQEGLPALAGQRMQAFILLLFYEESSVL